MYKQENDISYVNIYSYHTFIFPFYFGDTEEDIRSIRCKEISSINVSKYFVPKYYFGGDSIKKVKDYNIKSYFTKAARNLIGLDGEEFKGVKIYELDKSKYRDGKYVIRKNRNGEDGEELFEYYLDIFNLKIKLYDNGVGLILYELVNTKYNCLDDVNRINDFGRRIRAPFLSLKEIRKAKLKCSRAADSIEVVFNGGEYKISSLIIHDNCVLDIDYIPNIISKLFFEGSNIKIKSVDDDRMFVCCLVKNDSLPTVMKRKEKWTNLSFAEKQELYKLAYIEEFCSCQSVRMIDEVLSRTIYDRWINNGNCDFITNHSFIRLTLVSSDLDYIVSPFLYQYVEFASIALLQRATIKKASDNLSSNDVNKLHKYYVAQKSKVLFSKVTFQEQGDEKYKMIRKELDIDRMKAEFENHLEDLYNHENMENQNELNNIANRIGHLGIDLAIIGVCLSVVALLIAKIDTILNIIAFFRNN